MYSILALDNIATAHVAADVLENEPKPQTHNAVQENNNSVDPGYLLHQIAFHGHDMEVTTTCNRCNGEVFICEGCGYNMCSCDSNIQSRNGRNPFSSENDCFTCLNVSIIEMQPLLIG